MSGKITIPKKIEENKILGENNADNDFSTSLVVANSTGTVIERIADIQTTLGGSASQLKVSKSISSSVEEGGLLHFSISLIDIDSGPVSSANIDISGITQEMAISSSGVTFTSAGITQPVFEKSDGVVSCSYPFLIAEWMNGDMWRMTVSGITATVGGDTAYVETQQWSGEVTDNLDITATLTTIEGKVDDVKTVVDNIYIDTQAISIIVDDIQTNLLPDLSADVSGISVATDKKVAGRLQVIEKSIDLNQTIGTYTIFTGATQTTMLRYLSTKMPTGDCGGALTGITIQTDDITPSEIITTSQGLVAFLTSEAELWWTGCVRINEGTKIQLSITGGAHGSQYLSTITAGYHSVVDGGYLV